jgi:hypothetical protein
LVFKIKSNDNIFNELENVVADDEGAFAKVIIRNENLYGNHNCSYSSYEFCGFTSDTISEEDMYLAMDSIVLFFKEKGYDVSDTVSFISKDFNLKKENYLNDAYDELEEKYLAYREN